jgi:hypothetical protein
MLRAGARREREEVNNMGKAALEFLEQAIDQAFGTQPARKGKLGITWFGQKKMFDEDLSYKTLEEVFRYGEEIQQDTDKDIHMIVQKYKDCSVGLTAQYHSRDDRYMIINCWVRKWEKVK